MKPLLNLDEPVQRRSGEPARIIVRDALGGYPVIALCTSKDGTIQFSQSFTLRGSCSTDREEHPGDLINVPKVIEAGTTFLRCYLMEDGKIMLCTGSRPLNETPSGAIGAKAFHLVVRRGEWS